MIPGLTNRVTSSGIPVVRLHYSADPEKRPGTPIGDKWLEQAIMGYPGGTASPRWRKEQEIDYGALSGTKLFPEWERWSTNGAILIAGFDPTGQRLYGSYDHGWRNPATYHVHGINYDGVITTFFEFYDSHVPYTYIARIIKGEAVIVPPLGCCEKHMKSRHFRGNPYHGQEKIKYADPSMWAKDQPMKDGTNKSMADLFGKEGVYFTAAERGWDITVAEWLLGHFWLDPENPLYRITTECPMLIWELGQQRHKQISEVVALNRDQPEELVDKDNHAWDSLKYFLQHFPPSAKKPKPVMQGNTFTWWQKLAKEGGAQRTFRV